MKNTPKMNPDDAMWDNRELGASEEYVRKVSADREKSVDEGLDLQTISIRLQKSLIKSLKKLAEDDGIGYQPYIRQLLMRHVKSSYQEKRETNEKTIHQHYQTR